MFHVVVCILLLVIYMQAVVDWLGKRELVCLLSFTCNYMVSVWKGSLFLWVLGCVNLLWHSLSLPYSYLNKRSNCINIWTGTNLWPDPCASTCIFLFLEVKSVQLSGV